MIPDFNFEVGAEFDIGKTPEKEDIEKAAWREWTTPRILFPKFAINSINGTVSARVGEGPSTQRVWEVKRFCMALATPVGQVQPANTSVYLFRDMGGRGLVSPSNFEAMELLWMWTTFPIIQSWGKYEITIQQGEDLIVVVNSNAVFALSGNAQIIDIPKIDVALQMDNN
jgi:hypothetical protein